MAQSQEQNYFLDRGNSRQNSPVIGTVTGCDPVAHTVTVKLPGKLDDKYQTKSIPYASAMASTQYGDCFLPEPEDQVLVFFEDGEFDRPVALGAVWRNLERIPEVTLTAEDVATDVTAANDYRMIRSRSMQHLVFADVEGKEIVELRTKKGNLLSMQDEGGKEKIQIYDYNRTQWLEVDVEGKKITMQTDTGEILIKAKTKITMECEDLIIDATKTISVTSGQGSTWEAGQNFDLDAGAQINAVASSNMKLQGSKIDLNP